MSDPDRVTYRYKRFSIFAGPLVSVAMLVIAVALDWFLATADSQGPTRLPFFTVIAVPTVPVVLIVFFVDWLRTRNFETTCRFRPNPPRSDEPLTIEFEATMPEAPLGFNVDLARMEFGYKKAQRLWKESLAVPLERVETRDGKHRFSIKVTLPLVKPNRRASWHCTVYAKVQRRGAFYTSPFLMPVIEEAKPRE